MKKIILLGVIAASLAIFTQCKSTKAAASTRKLNYVTDIQPIMSDKCAPCHIPDKGGRIEALNSYAAVKGHIDDIIRRIELNPGDRGYMPFKKPKLSDSTINIIKQWKADGMPE